MVAGEMSAEVDSSRVHDLVAELVARLGSVQAVADRVGVTRQMVAMVRDGDRNPSPKLLAALEAVAEEFAQSDREEATRAEEAAQHALEAKEARARAEAERVNVAEEERAARAKRAEEFRASFPDERAYRLDVEARTLASHPCHANLPRPGPWIARQLRGASGCWCIHVRLSRLEEGIDSEPVRPGLRDRVKAWASAWQ